VTFQQLAERFAEVERERDAHLDDLKRLAAEFDNYRKRVAGGGGGGGR
jgi:molecular chaperone GrpE (heat shock protein)